jgi:lon-related putative ATP-dependent protease
MEVDMALELDAGRLRRHWTPEEIGVASTRDAAPTTGIVGQDRAVAALRFGLGIQSEGFHVYVAGPPGMGKMTAVRSFIEELAQKRPTPRDWCYVNNFEDPSRPRACPLPAGRARELQQGMRRLIAAVRRDIPRAFESDPYGTRRQELSKGFDRRRVAVIGAVREKAAEAGFLLQTTQMGILLAPARDGRVLTEEELQAMPPEAQAEILRRREALQQETQSCFKQIAELHREEAAAVAELDREVVLGAIGVPIDALRADYGGCPEVLAFIDAARRDLIDRIVAYKHERRADGEERSLDEDAGWRCYEVNVLVEQGAHPGAPVVVESHTDYGALFGRVEKETHAGTVYADFTMITAGALHRANGGYLVLRAEDVLKAAFGWEGLKRILVRRSIEIEDVSERLGLLTTRTVRPEPIPLDVKVVLVGSHRLYHLLYEYDEEFGELFKVKADFDVDMPATPENVHRVVGFLASLCAKEHLRPLDVHAIAKLLEHATRLADDRERLSTHFRVLADVVREANDRAADAGGSEIGEAHIRDALEQQVYRSNLFEERICELVRRNALLVQTDGAVVGQVNGLSVIDLGNYAFGRTNRITAAVGPGQEGVIDIEREAQLGGPLHSKGVMVLSGYLVRQYAQATPLALGARLAFEQSYQAIEGDSASCAELCAILSALSELPIRQSIAVTGSVNQLGEVQAIGGVNEKIEGFFRLCRARGLTGAQGVMIPEANIPNLMLAEDVVEAVGAGRFHIFAMRSVDEAIERLVGVGAGARGKDGRFPPGSVHQLVETRLAEMAELLREGPAHERRDARAVG